MNYLTLGIIGFTVGLSGAMLPGPMLAYAISSVLQGRIRNVISIVLGHIFIEAVMVILILLGLKQFIDSKIVFSAVSILGGVVLIIMGLQMIFNASWIKLYINKNSNFSSGLIWGGIFFTAFNPTFPTWWVSVGASLLSRALLLGLLGVVILVVGHWLADLAWFSFVGFAVSKGKLHLEAKSYQLILKILAIILITLGVWFIWQVCKITN